MKRIVGACLIVAMAALPILINVRSAEAGTPQPSPTDIVAICYTGGNGYIGYVIYVPYYFALKAVLAGKASFTWGAPQFPLPKTRLEFCDIRYSLG